MASEALRRLAFHLLAIETNEGALLIFEEPEAHLHPHHVRFLGKRIALDARNQYWISTHSPHFLLAVLEKAPLEDVAVFLTARRDGETWARPLGEEEIQGIVDDGCGFFFDLERLMSMFERS
jgi:predicted ATPase